jgi:ribosomal protein S7
MLVVKGGKKTITKHIYNSFAVIKYKRSVNPLLLLLEIIDKVKPSFRLRNYIVRRVQIKEYPIVTFRSRQLMIALHWLKAEIRSTRQLKSSLMNKIADVFLNFEPTSKNNLVKKRLEYTKRIVAGQFNIRYT